MKPQLEESIKIISETIANGKLTTEENQKLFLVLGLLQGLLILETIKQPA